MISLIHYSSFDPIRHFFDKRRSIDDLDAVVVFEVPKVRISGDDVKCIALVSQIQITGNYYLITSAR